MIHPQHCAMPFTSPQGQDSLSHVCSMPVDCVYVSQTRIQAFVMAMLLAASISFTFLTSTWPSNNFH